LQATNPASSIVNVILTDLFIRSLLLRCMNSPNDKKSYILSQE